MPLISLNVPHYKQEHPYSCVAACVRMVLAHFGRSHTEDELRQLLVTRPHGTPARNIALAGTLGFAVQLGSLNLARLRDALVAGSPPIVFLQTGPLDYWTIDCAHVAVLTGLDDMTAYLNDPFFDVSPQQTALTGFLRAWALVGHLAAVLRPQP